MKKSFVLLLTLVLLITGTACYAQNELLKEKDQVHFKEHALYGDKSIVDGVTVEADMQYAYNLYWNSMYEIGDIPKEETKYTFYPWTYQDVEYVNAGSIYFGMGHQVPVQIGNDTYEKEHYYGLEKAIKELFDKTAPGETKEITIYLKDYLEYYTFGMDLDLPSDVKGDFYKQYGYVNAEELREDLADWEKNGTNREEVKRVRKYLEILDVFQSFFKIPVLDKESYKIGMAKDKNGVVIGMSESSIHGGGAMGQIDIPDMPQVGGNDSFSFYTQSIFYDGDCFFTFDPHTENGKTVDVSQIPGGYGIYHFTYNEEGEVDVSGLKMVYALDSKFHLDEMRIDASGKNILLFTSDAERHYLSVIDRKTMTLVNNFTIGDSESYLDNWVYDDFIVVRTENLMVFSLGADGRYTQAVSLDYQKIKDTIESNTKNRNFLNWSTSFDWNGNTLVITDKVSYEADYMWSTYACNFFVAAVDATGLLYYGEYESSFTDNGLLNGCRFEDGNQNAIRIYWKK